MRESIGGAWLFSIVILFIALFTSYLAYSISYTRAFNMKSEILSLIEKNEGFTAADDTIVGDIENLSVEQLSEGDSVEEKILAKIKRAGYNYSAASDIDCTSVDHPSNTMQTGGYCVTKYCPGKENNGGTIIDSPDNKTYYKVTTFIAIRIPVINVIFKVPVTGETRTLYFDTSKSLECADY